MSTLSMRQYPPSTEPGSEQRGKSRSFLDADEVVQSTRTFKFHISGRSSQHSVSLRTSLIEISIFLTSGRAEKTDGEQGIEHTTMTNDAATEQVTDRVKGSSHHQLSPIATEHPTLTGFS